MKTSLGWRSLPKKRKKPLKRKKLPGDTYLIRQFFFLGTNNLMFQGFFSLPLTGAVIGSRLWVGRDNAHRPV